MISILIPCHNYARFLPDAIHSALAQAEEGFPVEVLVIDDGSTDDSSAVAGQYKDRIRYLHQSNAGLSATRNVGMQAAASDWVVFLDADDALLPGSVRALWEALWCQPSQPVLIAGREQVVDAAMTPKGPPPLPQSGRVRGITARELVLRNRFAPAVLADRRVLLDLGGFDPALPASEDRDMWIRAAARGPVALLDRITLLKRDHGGNMSHAAERQTASIRQVLKKASANPELHLSSHDWRLADAVCCYQSALMFAGAGDARRAAGQMLRSIVTAPFHDSTQTSIPSFARLRGLGSLLRTLIARPRPSSAESDLASARQAHHE